MSSCMPCNGAWPSLWASTEDREKIFFNLCWKHMQELQDERNAMNKIGKAIERRNLRLQKLEAVLKAAHRLLLLPIGYSVEAENLANAIVAAKSETDGKEG